MAVFPFCSLQTDARGMELAEHGSALFPVSCYDEDLVQTPVAWHWHEDLEILVITEGTARIDTGTERLLLPRGQGLFINAGMLHSIHSSEGGPCAPWSFTPGSPAAARTAFSGRITSSRLSRTKA